MRWLPGATSARRIVISTCPRGRSFAAVDAERGGGSTTEPFLIEDTVPRPIRTVGPLPTLMCARLAALRVITTDAIPLAAALEVTRTAMPERRMVFRL